MKLSAIKNIVKDLKTLSFQLPNGELVPSHFHVTEIGKITKYFIDCGGKIRHEEVINFQLWSANDYDHRLHPEKLLHIIDLSEKALALKDLEVEVEYQGETIGKYGMEFNGTSFVLTPLQTDCLAKDKCNIPEEEEVTTENNSSCCTPGGGCC